MLWGAARTRGAGDALHPAYYEGRPYYVPATILGGRPYCVPATILGGLPYFAHHVLHGIEDTAHPTTLLPYSTLFRHTIVPYTIKTHYCTLHYLDTLLHPTLLRHTIAPYTI
jgi:hypothetical protein